MGLAHKLKPQRLGEKLKKIREQLGLSQSELVRRIGFDDYIDRGKISEYERNERIPQLPILLAYARLANVYVDQLIDDELDLPARLPHNGKLNLR